MEYMLATDIHRDETELGLWTKFIQQNAHHLQEADEYWPSYKAFHSLADEHGDSSPITQKAEAWREDNCDWYWLKNLSRPNHPKYSALIRVLKGHNRPVTGALELSDGRLLSWSLDETLRLWNREGSPADHPVLEGHNDGVQGALELSDGRLLSWSWDKTLRLWNREGSPAEHPVLEGHNRAVVGALELSDGRLLSWSANQLLLHGCMGQRLEAIRTMDIRILNLSHRFNVVGINGRTVIKGQINLGTRRAIQDITKSRMM